MYTNQLDLQKTLIWKPISQLISFLSPSARGKALVICLAMGWFLAMVPPSAFGQGSKKTLSEANEAFDLKQFGRALSLYLDVLKQEPGNTEANYYTALCYLKTIYRQKALPYIQKAYLKNPRFDAKIDFFMGEAYQCANQFEEALVFYDLYKQNQRESDQMEMRLVNKRLEECRNGIQYIKKPVPAVIANFGPVVNGRFPDYAPVISANESVMFFTSRREGSTGGLLAPEDGLFYEDVYVTYHRAGNWSSPQNLGTGINTETHDACIAVSPNGKQLFIYQDSRDGDIYSSILLDSVSNQWSKPKSLGNNVNSKYHETSVSMTADGNTLYFSSDRPGGSGGLDIYLSRKNRDGHWGEAINLGPAINTPYDDDAPFVHPDGQILYFSSRGHATMGGFDIFRSYLENGQWTTPENLGFPINTSDEDIYFVLSADNRHGYYASAKGDGFGEKDIYIISLPTYEGLTFSDKRSPASGTALCLPFTTDLPKPSNSAAILRGTIRDESTRLPLEARIVLTDKQDNHVMLECSSSPGTGTYCISLPAGRSYHVAVEKQGYLSHSENYNLPTDSSYQALNSDVDLIFKERVNNEADYLIAKGPTLSVNARRYEIDDGFDVHQSNLRRVKRTEPETNPIPTDTSSLEAGPDMEFQARMEGAKKVLQNIAFHLGSATLTKGSAAGLMGMVRLLNRSSQLKMEISGHSDSTGSANLNQKLSKARAKAVVDYLLAKGVPSTQLIYKGYGSTRPIATNATLEGRQRNRRTEFKVVGN